MMQQLIVSDEVMYILLQISGNALQVFFHLASSYEFDEHNHSL